MRKNEAGFTLIELMIVIAIIAIIAAIAIPNLLAAKVSTNETGALATLRTLATCQAQIQTTGKIDTDADGIGEFGTFLELTGSVAVRKKLNAGNPNTSDFTAKGTVVTPAVLSAALGNVDVNGFVTKSGYAFMIFLPDGTIPVAKFVHETGPATAVALTGGSGNIGVDLSETTFCAYAQPVAAGTSGNRRFFVNQSADVMQSANDTTKFQGSTANAINGNSAFRADGITALVATGTKGQDGDVWKVSN